MFSFLLGVMCLLVAVVIAVFGAAVIYAKWLRGIGGLFLVRL